MANKRTDEYGGSFDNRARFLLETLAAVRAVWPERLPLTARLGVIDYVEGEQPLDDSIELVLRMKDGGLDLIDVSMGFNTPDVIPTQKWGRQRPEWPLNPHDFNHLPNGIRAAGSYQMIRGRHDLLDILDVIPVFDGPIFATTVLFGPIGKKISRHRPASWGHSHEADDDGSHY